MRLLALHTVRKTSRGAGLIQQDRPAIPIRKAAQHHRVKAMLQFQNPCGKAFGVVLRVNRKTRLPEYRAVIKGCGHFMDRTPMFCITSCKPTGMGLDMK